MPNAYEKRLIRVLDYIHDYPAADLSLDAMADLAAMSRFHWHRVFQAMTGQTLAQAVRRIRLHRAACYLVQTDRPVGWIARTCGYDNLRSFGRSFADHYALTPAAFRARGTTVLAYDLRHPERTAMFEVEIVTTPPRRMVTMPHRGPYHEISRAFGQLSAILAARELFGHVSGMVAVFHDDISVTTPADLRSHAGFLVDAALVMPDGTDELMLAGGRHAVLHFRGPYSGLMAGYTQLYGTWLPTSGAEPRDAPPFEVYLNSPMDAAPEDLLTDICLPLK